VQKNCTEPKDLSLLKKEFVVVCRPSKRGRQPKVKLRKLS
jgi:hypothetical protein